MNSLQSFFTALPGTLPDFSNLLSISNHHGLSALSAAGIEDRGPAQVFGSGVHELTAVIFLLLISDLRSYLGLLWFR
jgi:hypothetical protein